MDSSEERLIAETAQANRALGVGGQGDMVWGHASIRDPNQRGVWMKASGWSFDEVTSDRVALVSPDGGSVVHTHAPAAVSFASLDVPLLAISHDGVEFAEPQIPRFNKTGALISSAELGRALLLARACHNQLQAMAAGPIRKWSDPAEIALKKRQVWPQAQISAGYAYLCRQAGLTTVREITVGVVAPAYVNVPLWVAQERGFLQDRGLSAVERILGRTDAVTSALRDGEIDIALTAPEGSIADAVAGGPLRVVAGLVDRPPLSLVALPRHHTVDDLRGGRIGTSSMTEGTRHVAERMLASRGLAYPADYEFALEGSHVERWKALQAGTIDAALQMIPYDDIAVDAGFTDLGPATGAFSFNAACVRLPADPAVVAPFLQALAEAVTWFRDHVEESAAIAAARTGMEPRYALSACRKLAADGVIPNDLRSAPEALAAAVAALRSSGLIPPDGPDPLAAAVDYSYLP